MGNALLAVEVDTNPPAKSFQPVISGVVVNSCVGEISIVVSAGVEPYSYSWEDSGGNSVGTNSDVIDGLSPDTYTVTVTDAMGLTVSGTYTITDPPPLLGTVDVTDVLCFGDQTGIAEVTMSNGVRPYIWELTDLGSGNMRSGSTQTDKIEITNLGAANYSLWMRDLQGCVGTLTFTVDQPLSPVGANLLSSQDPLCYQDTTGFITVEGTGGTVTGVGYTYAWYNGPQTVDNLISDSTTLINVGAGTYTLLVRDQFGCTYREDFDLFDPAELIVSDTTIVDASCFGFTDGNIDVTAIGGTGTLDYSWSNGANTQDLTNVAAGTYTLTITDDNGCTLVESYTVNQPNAITLTESITNISCRGESAGAINVTVTGGSGGYDISWADAPTVTDTNRSGLTAGDYTLTVTDDTGCTSSGTYTITEPTAGLSIDSFTEVSPSCFGGADGSLAVNVSGGVMPYAYTWSNGGNTQMISNLTAGNYEVLITDANGCTLRQDIDLTDPTAITANPVFTLPSCNGDNNGSITVAATNGVAPYTYSWSNGDAGPTVNNLAAGSYVVTITDNTGCSINETVVLTEPDALTDNAMITNVSCNGFANGSIVLGVQGGTAPYSYLWNTTATTSSLNTLAPGNYTVTITDANGCTINRDYSITEPNPLALASSKVDVLCFGEATGSIDVTVTGGTAPYTYIWTNGATTEDLVNVVADTYTLTVTDANGCMASEVVSLTEPASGISVTETVTDLSCSGDPTGIITLDVSGGTAPYTYEWNDGVTTQDRTGLTQGNYSVTIRDANDCSVVRNITIGQPDGLNIAEVIQNITCHGDNDGAIDITITGGTAPYTIDWGGGINTEDRTGLVPGSYSVVVTDANGCQANATMTITQPDELIATSANTDILCFGESTGAIDLSVTGGTIPYSYSWSNGMTNEDLTGLVAGNYTVLVTDANGCTVNHSVMLEEPVAALSVNGAVNNESCSGFSNAGVVLTVSGGTAPYTYNWSDGSTDKDIVGVFPGSYQVTVTDANGCTQTENYTITGPQPLNITATVTDLVCFEQANGSIDLMVFGGTGPYSYSWNNGASTEDLSGLLAGTYEVTVTDANGCSTISSFTLTQPSELIVNSVINGVSCFGEVDGSIDLGVTGGVAPYNYSWSNDGTTQDLSALIGGDYTVTVTDANGCSLIQTYNVPAPTGPLAASVTVVDVACNGDQTGGVVLNVTGGTAPFTYAWSNGSTFKDLINVFPGNYTVDITDANGCTFNTGFEIAESTPITATITATEPTCFGDSNGSILLEVAGGVAPYSYFWSNGSTSKDQFGLLGGPYVVTIRDANDCTITQNIDLGGNRGLDISVNKVDVLCKGEATGTIALEVFGGTGNFTYAWNTGATTNTIASLTAGVYECVVTDEDGCDNSVTVTIAEPSQVLSASIDFTQLLACFEGNDGLASVTPQGGTAPYTYLWSNGERSQTITGLTADLYTVIVTDANGCSFQENFRIEEPEAAIQVAASGKLMLDCQGDQDGSISVAITGGRAPYRLLWNNGVNADNLNNLRAGDYILQVTDALGCTHEAVINVSEPAPISISSFTINDTQCYNDRTGSIEIEVDGGTNPYSYQWSNGSTSRNLSGVGTGGYQVVITDANGCTFQQQFQLDNAPLFELQPVVTPISCTDENDASISLNITGGTGPMNISWSNGADDEVISGLSPGTYEVLVTDASGCVLEQVFNITNPLPLTFEGVIENAIECNQPESGTVSLIVSGGTPPYSYSWSNGMTTRTISNVPPGQYTATVIDRFGCTHQDVFNVTRPNAINVDLVPELITDCDSQEALTRVTAVATGGMGDYTYDWSRGNSNSQTTEITTPGLLTLVITDERGCQKNAEVEIEFPSFGQASFTFTSASYERDLLLSSRDSIYFSDRSGEDIQDWQWNFGDGFGSTEQNPGHIYPAESLYEVTLQVIDQAGCVTDTTQVLDVVAGYRLIIPNVFTPDGDGLNDFFIPKFSGFQSFRFSVFSSSGQLIYSTSDLRTRGWDGTVNGQLMRAGQYAYKFVGFSFTGVKVERAGAFGMLK